MTMTTNKWCFSLQQTSPKSLSIEEDDALPNSQKSLADSDETNFSPGNVQITEDCDEEMAFETPMEVTDDCERQENSTNTEPNPDHPLSELGQPCLFDAQIYDANTEQFIFDINTEDFVDSESYPTGLSNRITEESKHSVPQSHISELLNLEERKHTLDNSLEDIDIFLTQQGDLDFSTYMDSQDEILDLSDFLQFSNENVDIDLTKYGQDLCAQNNQLGGQIVSDTVMEELPITETLASEAQKNKNVMSSHKLGSKANVSFESRDLSNNTSKKIIPSEDDEICTSALAENSVAQIKGEKRKKNLFEIIPTFATQRKLGRVDHELQKDFQLNLKRLTSIRYDIKDQVAGIIPTISPEEAEKLTIEVKDITNKLTSCPIPLKKSKMNEIKQVSDTVLHQLEVLGKNTEQFLVFTPNSNVLSPKIQKENNSNISNPGAKIGRSGRGRGRSRRKVQPFPRAVLQPNYDNLAPSKYLQDGNSASKPKKDSSETRPNENYSNNQGVNSPEKIVTNDSQTKPNNKNCLEEAVVSAESQSTKSLMCQDKGMPSNLLNETLTDFQFSMDDTPVLETPTPRKLHDSKISDAAPLEQKIMRQNCKNEANDCVPENADASQFIWKEKSLNLTSIWLPSAKEIFPATDLLEFWKSTNSSIPDILLRDFSSEDEH